MTFYLYPSVLFFGTNITIAKILFSYTLWDPPTLKVPNLGPLPYKINVTAQISQIFI